MCGLTGSLLTRNLTTQEEAKRQGVQQGLLVAMQARGSHSTGVCSIKNGIPKIYKNTQEAIDFIGTRQYNETLKDSPEIIMGHTRFATQGKITNRNAHPFDIDNIIGTHNGIIYNTDETLRKAKHEVDSELIFHAINNEKNLQKAIDRINGSIAIAWIDKRKPSELNLFTDGSNSLYVAYVQEIKAYFYASTIEPLEMILPSYFPSKTDIKTVGDNSHLIINTRGEIKEKTLEDNYNYYDTETKEALYQSKEAKYPCELCGTFFDYNTMLYCERDDYLLCSLCSLDYKKQDLVSIVDYNARFKIDY